MKITIIGRKCSPRESFKERVERKLSKIERLFGENAEVKVTATVEKTTQIVEITVYKNGMIFRAEENAENLDDAFDACLESLIRQIRKNKTKLEKKLHTSAFSEMIGLESVAEEIDFDIVRTKTVSLKPQDVDEAILQMNMVGHQFYMFLNSATEKVNVVYVRKDGGYGVLEPDIE